MANEPPRCVLDSGNAQKLIITNIPQGYDSTAPTTTAKYYKLIVTTRLKVARDKSTITPKVDITTYKSETDLGNNKKRI